MDDTPLEPEAPDPGTAPGASAGAWPPRPGPLPRNPLLPAGQELRLDPSDGVLPPPPRPEFSETKLRSATGGPAPEGHERGAQAVAYDHRRAPGRSRYDQIFDVQDEDFRRLRWVKAREGAMTGGFSLLVVCLSFLPLQLTPVATTVGAGAVAGAAAALLGDTIWVWFAALGAAGLVFLGLTDGMLWALAQGACLLVGWIAGLTREVRH